MGGSYFIEDQQAHRDMFLGLGQIERWAPCVIIKTVIVIVFVIVRYIFRYGFLAPQFFGIAEKLLSLYSNGLVRYTTMTKKCVEFFLSCSKDALDHRLPSIKSHIMSLALTGRW